MKVNQTLPKDNKKTQRRTPSNGDLFFRNPTYLTRIMTHLYLSSIPIPSNTSLISLLLSVFSFLLFFFLFPSPLFVFLRLSYIRRCPESLVIKLYNFCIIKFIEERRESN